MMMMVEVNRLRKEYKAVGGRVAVDDISFDVKPGEIFSLLGPNGAGKTSTIAMLSCLLPPTGGDALIDGFSILHAKRRIKQIIGVVPQEIALYPSISARENLVFWGRMFGLNGKKLKERIAAVLDIVALADRADDRVSTFSGGMQRRLNIAVGLVHEPKMLYLDEPTVGIDPQSRRRILDTIKELNRQGLTVLYTTHYMEEAEELSNRIGIIDQGKLIALGTLEELTLQLGGADTVQLDLDVEEGSLDAVARRLDELPGVAQTVCDTTRVAVRVQQSHQVLPHLIAAVGAAGVQIKGIEIQRPNLEAVFLHLTGRALRD